MMLVWRKGNIEKKNGLCCTVLCAIIMVHKGTRYMLTVLYL